MNTSGKKILVIDDDQRHLTAVKEILEMEGHVIYTYYQPFGASQVARKLDPDLILLDVNMPGLSGGALSRVISSYSKAAIVFYSSNDEDTLRQMVKSHRVKGYICKGDIFNLRTKVASYLMQD